MPLFRRGLPKRAVAGAFVGFLYGVLIMTLSSVPGGGLRELLMGAGWILLSVSLLFGRVLSYYVYISWALLWMVWQAFLAFGGGGIAKILDVLVPLVSIALLSSSGYVERLQDREP